MNVSIMECDRQVAIPAVPKNHSRGAGHRTRQAENNGYSQVCVGLCEQLSLGWGAGVWCHHVAAPATKCG